MRASALVLVQMAHSSVVSELSVGVGGASSVCVGFSVSMGQDSTSEYNNLYRSNNGKKIVNYMSRKKCCDLVSNKTKVAVSETASLMVKCQHRDEQGKDDCNASARKSKSGTGVPGMCVRHLGGDRCQHKDEQGNNDCKKWETMLRSV